MIRYYSILLLILLLTGCNQNSSQAEKEYIENLEKKNAALEKELQDRNNSPKESKQSSKKSKDYFTIGSTEDDVLDVMGDPTTYRDIGFMKILNYGSSSINLKNGKVTGYDNVENNLKVMIR